MIKLKLSAAERRARIQAYLRTMWCFVPLGGAILVFNAGGWQLLIAERPFVLFKSQIKDAYGESPFADSLATAFESQILEPNLEQKRVSDPEAYARVNSLMADKIGDVWIDRSGVAFRLSDAYYGVSHDQGWVSSSLISWICLPISARLLWEALRDLNPRHRPLLLTVLKSLFRNKSS